MYRKFRESIRVHEELALILIAALANLLFVFTHECWRDEAQAWLIARDNTIFSLFDVTSYEGHPFLWFYVLMPFARLGFPYFTLKVISYVIVLAAIVIIALKSPFGKLTKAIFILSPMCIYCFVTPARNYCLCALFVTLAAMKYKDRDKQPLLYGLILGLTLQTHVIMAAFVVAECTEWFVSVIMERKFDRRTVMQLAGMGIAFVSGLFLLYEFRDTGKALSAFGHPEFQLSRKIIVICFFFVWITLISIVGIWKRLRIAGPFIVLAASVLWQVWMHYFAYPLGNFRTVTWLYLLMWFIWVVYDTNTDIRPLKNALLLFALAAVLYMWKGTRWIVMHDVYEKYSGAQAAALQLETLPDDAVIVESIEASCTAVVPYLKGKVIYNPFQMAEASYISWDPSARHRMTYDEFIAACREMFPDKKSVYVLSCFGKEYISGLSEHLTDENLYWEDDKSTVIGDECFSIHRIDIPAIMQGIP